MTLKDQLSQSNEAMLFADGFDDALIGVLHRYGQPPIACYDLARCLEILVDQGMTPEGAQEYFEFNVMGAYVGENTPCFLERASTASSD